MEQVTGMAPTSARVVLTYLAVVAAGAGLFFLIFGAIFNGLWSLLAIFLLCYLGVGAAAVGIGGVRPMPAAHTCSGRSPLMRRPRKRISP